MPFQHHRSSKPALIVAAAVIVIIIAIALSLAAKAPTVSSTSTFTLANGSATTFYLPDSANASSVYIASASGSGAMLYIGHNPVLTNKIAVADLSPGQSVNVSASHAAQADLQIKLVSSSSGSVTLALTYVPSSLGVAVSPWLSYLNATTSQHTYASTSPTTQSTTLATTSVTTTVSVNKTQAALELANTTSYGVLINKYKALYRSDAGACTKTQYDIDYSKAFGAVPSGPSTFANVSVAVPTTIISSITKLSAAMYNITYSSVSGIGTYPAMRIEFNATGQYVVTSKFMGIYQGESYATVSSAYQSMNSSDACAAYVP